jgi:hypothetical protein
MPAKRILTAALAVLLAASFAAPSGARAVYSDGFEYTVTGSTATVTGCSYTCSGALEIPEELGGYSVTAIGASAFDGVFDVDGVLTSVVIPHTVERIEAYAFRFNSLTSVRLPFRLTSIGIAAFYGNALTSVVIPYRVASIGEGAFYDNALTSVTIGNSVTSIGEFAFGQNLLTTLTIGNSVTTIGRGAFSYNLLTTVTIPNSVTSIAESAFFNNALSTVVFGNSVTSIGPGAFQDNALTNLTFPASLMTVTGSAFAYNDLNSVTFLGNAPTAVEDNVFAFNANLASVTRSSTATGWGLTWGGTPVAIADAQATATVKPTVTGTSTVGKTLTAAKGTWAGYPTPTFTYQWYACTKVVSIASLTIPATCKKISGATRSTFKLTSAQRGKYVAVLVTGKSLRTTATTWLSTTTAKVR